MAQTQDEYRKKIDEINNSNDLTSEEKREALLLIARGIANEDLEAARSYSKKIGEQIEKAQKLNW